MSDSLVILWFSGVFGVCLCAARLVLRKWRGYTFARGEYLTIVAMACLIIRVVLVDLITVWQTTTTLGDAERAADDFTPTQWADIVIASKLLICNRVFSNVFCWALKLAVLELCTEIVVKLVWRRPILVFYYFIFATSFVGVTLAAVLECRPFSLYWQIEPNPGECATGDDYLLVFGALNIFTDMMLIAIPLPLILQVRMTFKKKCQLVPLFSLGFFLVGITIFRVVVTLGNSHIEFDRSTGASAEVIAATIVAQVPVIYILLRKTHGRAGAAGRVSEWQTAEVYPRVHLVHPAPAYMRPTSIRDSTYSAECTQHVESV